MMRREEKQKEIEELVGLINKYKVIGILNMHKLPARQLLMIKKKLQGKAIIRMSKKTMIKRAFESLKDGKADVGKLFDIIKEEPALLFSNNNPFSLFKTIKESRSPASAKAGDVATKDITIEKGSTGLPPGPAISTLQKVGLKASVQDGKIAVMQDKIVCKQGDVINGDTASVLALMKIEPLEIGLDLIAVYEEGMIYAKNVLDVSAEDYLNNLMLAVQQGITLSLEIGYVTKETATIALQKAFREARQIALECSLIEKEFIDEVLMKAVREAKMLENIKK
ncbi:MAG: 50S ribosomal protein L10 [Candidatus Aenigmarchaeota archaeon]|nr:50S ribosomal protein L10 [Candidatus Aenigmarchaeota archaeon]